MKLRDIIKTDNIIRLAPSESLSTAFSKLSSSHDAAFIFKDNQLLGLVNPYHCIIKTSHPLNAKIADFLFHPPHIYINDSIAKVVEKMNYTRLHYLPVFNEKNDFAGIISARRLLKTFAYLPIFHHSLGEVIKAKSRVLVTIAEDETLAIALALLRLEKVSKLVVVNRHNRLCGLLSQYDLVSFLIAPEAKEIIKERKKRLANIYNYRVKKIARKFVLTLTEKNTLSQALQLILIKRIGSVVVLNEKKYPVGIITSRDCLQLLRRHEPEKIIYLQWKFAS